MTDRPQVVILGCGFGGLGAVQQLADAPVDIALIDKHDYHTFQPLLYQVATAELNTTTVGHPIRDMLHQHTNICFHQTAVTGIDLQKKTVQAEGMQPLPYDYLVVGLGALVNFFHVPGAAEHAFPLYTLEHAVRLRKHILEVLEAADKNPELVNEGALNVIVVGGGPTGVETAGALTDLFSRDFVQDYPNLPMDKVRIILVDGGPALLGPFNEDIQQYAKRSLEKLGVELHLQDRVSEVTAKGATLKSGGQLPASTVIWAGGLQANPVMQDLGIQLAHGGRLPVLPDLSVEGHPEVFAVGDNAEIKDAPSGAVLPQLASVALQAGKHAGKCIAHGVEGKATEPFHYHNKGIMATIGRYSAAVELPGGLTLTGPTAWLAWGAVHLALLTGAESRASALIDWSWGLFTHHHTKRIDVDD